MARILITERQLERLSRTVKEESGMGSFYREKFKSVEDGFTYEKNNCISPKETAFELQNELNDLLNKSINEALSKIPISLDDDGVVFDAGTLAWGTSMGKTKFDSSIKLEGFLNELFNNSEMGKCFKILYDNFPVISNQLNSGEVELNFNYIGPYKFLSNVKKKSCKGRLKDRENLTLLDASTSAFCIYNKQIKRYTLIEGASSINLIKLQLAGAEILPNRWTPETPTPTPVTNDCECEDLSTGKMIKHPCKGPLPEACKEDVIIPVFEVMGDSLPYADNMVMPYFNKFPDAKEQFGFMRDAFVTYIKAGGGDKLTNVTIKGSADSARPTEQVPPGYGNELDHPGGKPWFGGKTGNKERNQWLADNRARQYANALIKAVKDRTGFDLKIKVLPGDNYYGQAGKRGKEFRKITLSPNAPKHKGAPKKK